MRGEWEHKKDWISFKAHESILWFGSPFQLHANPRPTTTQNGCQYVMNRGYKGLHHTTLHPCYTHKCVYILSVSSTFSLRSHCQDKVVQPILECSTLERYESNSATKIRRRFFSLRTSTVPRHNCERWQTEVSSGHEHNAHCDEK